MSSKAQQPCSVHLWSVLLLAACAGCDASPAAERAEGGPAAEGGAACSEVAPCPEAPVPAAGGALGASGVGGAASAGSADPLCGEPAPSDSVAVAAGECDPNANRSETPSWYGIASYLPVAIRNYYPPSHHSSKVGFRCARTP